MNPNEVDWVPDACTLPTVQRPLRVAEFDELFTVALRGQRRLSPTGLRWEFDAASETAVRDLTARESACCSFFTFDVSTAGGLVLVDVLVPAGREEVLDGLAERARHRGSAR